jgi:hypothetical protein
MDDALRYSDLDFLSQKRPVDPLADGCFDLELLTVIAGAAIHLEIH